MEESERMGERKSIYIYESEREWVKERNKKSEKEREGEREIDREMRERES